MTLAALLDQSHDLMAQSPRNWQEERRTSQLILDRIRQNTPDHIKVAYRSYEAAQYAANRAYDRAANLTRGLASDDPTYRAARQAARQAWDAYESALCQWFEMMCQRPWYDDEPGLWLIALKSR